MHRTPQPILLAALLCAAAIALRYPLGRARHERLLAELAKRRAASAQTHTH